MNKHNLEFVRLSTSVSTFKEFTDRQIVTALSCVNACCHFVYTKSTYAGFHAGIPTKTFN